MEPKLNMRFITFSVYDKKKKKESGLKTRADIIPIQRVGDKVCACQLEDYFDKHMLPEIVDPMTL